jgi:hypothetical protein
LTLSLSQIVAKLIEMIGRMDAEQLPCERQNGAFAKEEALEQQHA